MSEQLHAWGNGLPWYTWRHITKLDPEKTLSDDALNLVLASGTDAIIVGGTLGVTRQNTWSLLERLRSCQVPIVLEVSHPELAAPGADLYLIPSVLNTDDADWVVGHQASVAALLGDIIPWNMLMPEAYLVLNPNSSVARLTGARCDLDRAALTGYAAVAGQLWRLPLLYLEYSGEYGDPDLTAAVRRASGAARLFYGGGVTDAGRAAAVAAAADTVVVGNLVYMHIQRLAETVRAVHATPPPR